MTRHYKVYVCPDCGALAGWRRWTTTPCVCGSKFVTRITATDNRDVEPLVEALRWTHNYATEHEDEALQEVVGSALERFDDHSN